MYSDPIPDSDVTWRKSDPHLLSEEDKNPAEQPQAAKLPSSSADPSLFSKLLVSCGGFVETAALLLGPSNCISCVDEPLRSCRTCRSPRSMKRHSSKPKLKLASKLKDSPSREGEVVDVPIKLVKSRSSKAKENEDGGVYDPYRSFDDSISAISAHTLDEMARRYPKPFMATHRTGRSASARPRNGDELRPPSPARISDDSSDDSGQRVESSGPNEIENDIPFRRKFEEPLQITKVEQNQPAYELIENDIPFMKKKRPSRRSGNGKSDSTPTKKASARPVDKHNEPTPKAKGRKSRRRSPNKRNQDEAEPQFGEI